MLGDVSQRMVVSPDIWQLMSEEGGSPTGNTGNNVVGVAVHHGALYGTSSGTRYIYRPSLFLFQYANMRCLVPFQASSSQEPVAAASVQVPSSDKGKQVDEDVAMEDIKEELDDNYGDDVAGDHFCDDEDEEDL